MPPDLMACCSTLSACEKGRCEAWEQFHGGSTMGFLIFGKQPLAAWPVTLW